ncbi:MAG: two-component system sensor histidine kinase NtrB, partial [Limisphaerales bacterium]
MPVARSYGNHDGELVTVEGRLVGQTRSDEEHLVTLNDGLRVITAVMPFKEVTSELIHLPPDSELRLTGICEYRSNHRREAEGYQLLLWSGKDIELVAPAPWWTGDRLLLAVGGLLVVALGSLGWVNFLRRRVEQTQGRFAAAFQASPVPVAIVTRTQFRFINVNRSFLNQFEFRRANLIGKTADSVGLFPSPEKKRRLLDRLMAGSSVQDFEGEIRTKDGRELRVILSAEIIDLDGEECLLVLFQDVTERVNLMNQLRESQKMEAIGQLAAGVAHDFNNLLTIIRGNSELIGMMVDRNSEVAELNGEMDHAADRAADLTRQLLAFSRKQVMQKTTFDLNGIVVGSTKMLQRLLGEKITVRQELAPATVPLIADSGMLDQIIMNLAINAR